MAFHMGLEHTPQEWLAFTDYASLGLSKAMYVRAMYTALGNGVPVYMAQAFGLAMALQTTPIYKSIQEPIDLEQGMSRPLKKVKR